MSEIDTAPMPKPFRRLAWSNFSAQFSEQVALAAAPLAAVLLLGATAADTGFLQAAQTLPFLLFSLPAGVLADRMSRRSLMVASEMLRAASLLAILMLLLSGHLELTLLGLLGAVGAIGTVVYSVAAPALIPMLVFRSQLGDANRWLELARSSAFVAGPTVGGAIVGWTGASSAYVLAVGLSVTAVTLLSGLPVEARPQSVKRNPFVELREGAAFVAQHALLRPVLLTAVFFNLSWFVIQGIFVVYAVRHLGLSAPQVGATFGTYGAGMLVGALVTPWLIKRVAFGVMITIGPATALVGALTMVTTIVYSSGVLAAGGFFLFGVGPIIWVITTATLRQAVTPGPMLGRVSAVLMTATSGSRPVGAAIGAVVAARYGTEACMVVAAVGFVIQFAVIVSSSVPRLQELPQAA